MYVQEKAVSHYSHVSFALRHRPTTRVWHLHFRLFPDGLSFRYSLPAINATYEPRHVIQETSHFFFPFTADDAAWFFERDKLSHYELLSYAGVFRTAPASSLSSCPRSRGPLYGAPLIFHDVSAGAGPFPYRLLTEAALYEYPGMRYTVLPDNNTFRADLDETVTLSLPLPTPWRVILLARTLDELINSDVIASLNPAPDPDLFPSYYFLPILRQARSLRVAMVAL
ncbi:unnamed protein product [Vitrella brassicaformis CCMP3155]|uniref:Glycosyl-hydrolase 97 N-terminal domain-containing protein n=1 Tax=Vitrella brassicaformis (strain CCMP3155) TaxID=1169540 RepID=A0A0G4H8X0_VITBC|nr:unnamed protein product [Vitrella brassicaformis CCMP3155]|eukprot:CEM40149.1 unnamed protein product [Vitrella brassicaformis CCMP3155]